MCGIVGLFDYQKGLAQWPEAACRDMIHAIAHRGPDGDGLFIEPGIFLGHTRLAILDLSENARQPMRSDDGRFMIVYNGEIYNFKELRTQLVAKGYAFLSTSDTEVLIAAWRVWGEACLSKLDGIFAFGIYDRLKKTLILVRDPLGVKPLFYWQDDRYVAFASELQAMFGPVIECPPPDPADVNSYFSFNYLAAPRTGLAGARQLPPGWILRADANGIRCEQYWRLRYDPEPAAADAATKNKFRGLFADAIQGQLVADVPVGLFLSGGLDSLSIAWAIALRGGALPAFTLGFRERGFDESAAAAHYARYLHWPHEVCKYEWSEAAIRRLLASLRELLADASCFPVHQLTQFARQRVKVALSGDGGDELLAGYDTYRAVRFTPWYRSVPAVGQRTIKSILRRLPSGNRRYGWRMIAERFVAAAEQGHGREHATFRLICSTAIKQRLFTPDFFHAVAALDPIEDYAARLKEVPSTRSYLTACQHADLTFHLPSILAKVDRMSMAHGLEVRVPFLSPALVQCVINLPDEMKQRRGKGKRVLREWIAASVPRAALRRRKAGFLPPVDQWFREKGPMTSVFNDFVQDAEAKDIGCLQWDRVRELWSDHRLGRVDAGFILLGILQFINWSMQCRATRRAMGRNS